MRTSNGHDPPAFRVAVSDSKPRGRLAMAQQLEPMSPPAPATRLGHAPPGQRATQPRSRLRAGEGSLAAGVSSNFRLGGDPVTDSSSTTAYGAHLVDVDGNDYVDYVLGMGPGILGHAPAPSSPRSARKSAAASYSRADHRRGRTWRAVPGRGSVCGTRPVRQFGTEWSQAALRIARSCHRRRRDRQVRRTLPRLAGSGPRGFAPPLDVAGPQDAPIAAPPRWPDRVVGGQRGGPALE